MQEISDKLFDFLKKDNKANPFHEEFKGELLYEKMKEENLQNTSLFEFLVFSNAFYEEVKAVLKKNFRAIKISKKRFLELMFAKANSFFKDVIAETQKALSRELVSDFEKVNFLKSENLGKDIDIKFLVEIGPDIIAEAIKWIGKFEGSLIEFSSEGESDIEAQEVLIQKVWVIANTLINIRDSAYAIISYENGTVKYSEQEGFRVISGLEALPFLKVAGELRSQNHITEVQARLKRFITPSKPSHLGCNSIGDKVEFQIVEEPEKFGGEIGSEAMLVYHFYLINTALKYFDGLTLKELNNFLSSIAKSVSLLVHSKDYSAEHIPIKFSKNNLLDIITRITTKKGAAAERILYSLCSSQQSPYFWRGAFYEYEDCLYAPLVALTAPNYNFYIEKWLELSGITDEEREKLFAESIIEELSGKEAKYEFGSIKISAIGLKEEYFTNNVLLKTRDFYVLLQTVLYSFPIEFDEVDNALNIVSQSVETLKAKKSLIETFLTEKDKGCIIIPIIITTYTHFSGLVLNEVPIADVTLFNNYFDTGKYNRTKVVFFGGDYSFENPAELEYYKNEDEFNHNIIPFFKHPVPVYEIINKLFLKEITITPPFLKKQVSIQKIEFQPDEVTVDNDIQHLAKLLITKYYGSETDENSRLEDLINFQVHTIFNKLSYSSKDLLAFRANMYRAISKVKEIGFFYLSVYIINTLPTLKISIKKEEYEEINKFDDTGLLEILTKLMILRKGKQQITSFTIGNILTTEEKHKILSYAFLVVSNFSPGSYKEEEFDTYAYALMLLCGLRNDFRIDEILFSAFSNLVDHLNFNNRYQDARDICEDILNLYIGDKRHWNAWCILFKCYTTQQNHFDAAIYGCMLFNTLTALPEIPYYLAVASLHNSLIFFRNFHYFDLGKRIFESVQDFPLKDYDRQKFTASYFYMAILNPVMANTSLYSEITAYLKKNIDKIMAFEDHGIVPWLSIIYNLIRLKNEYLFEVPEELIEFKEALELKVDKTKKEHIQTIVLGKTEQLKETFIRSLVNLYETRDVKDFSAEINNLAPIAQNLLQYSIEITDIDGILLAGQVLNDQTFTFKNKWVEEGALREFNLAIEEESKNRWRSYGSKILDQLQIQNGQVILWIFELYRKVYCLEINQNKEWKINELKNWDLVKMRTWVKELSRFYFNSRKVKSYDIVEQEMDYNDVKTKLKFAHLLLQGDYSEIFYISSINLSDFPHNLLQSKEDFVGSQVPICNVLSLERYLIKSSNRKISRSFSSSAWIPIEDKEGTINWGYNLLLPLLTDLKSNVHTTRYPKEEINSDLNIFLAHGETGAFGFKIIHTNPEIGGTIIYPSSVFGSGTIAILFVCNTGKVSDDLYSNNIISFAAELLKRNYEAVVAPFWKLDVTICPIWLKEFLSSMEGGYSVNESVYMANQEISKYQEIVSNSFFAVEGQLAMHLYGNPNIYINIT